MAWLGALAGWLCGCESLWSRDAPYDPLRCSPACQTGKVCVEGRCQASDARLKDARADDGHKPDMGPPNDASLCVGSSSPYCPWVTLAGGSSDEEGRGVAVDSQGDVWVVGDYVGTAEFGQTSLTARGMKDLFLTRLGPTGAFIWSVSAGSISNDSGKSVALDEKGNAYICGSLDIWADENAMFGTLKNSSSVGGTHAYVAKVDAKGNFLWVTLIGAQNDSTLKGGGAVCTGVVLNSAGQIFIVGYFGKTVAFGSGKQGTFTAPGAQPDAFVAKLDSSGQFEWVTQAGGTDFDCMDRIALHADGDVLVVGTFQGSAWFGTQNHASMGGIDLFMSRLDGEGKFRWTLVAAGVKDDWGFGAATDSQGNSFIAGSFTSQITVGTESISSNSIVGSIVAKADKQGHWVWAKQIGGVDSHVKTIGLTRDSTGNLWVTGYFYGTLTVGSSALTSAGDADIFVANLDSAGVALWGKSAGGLLWDNGQALALDASGGPYVTGTIKSPATFNGVSKTLSLGSDVFVWKSGLK